MAALSYTTCSRTLSFCFRWHRQCSFRSSKYTV